MRLCYLTVGFISVSSLPITYDYRLEDNSVQFVATLYNLLAVENFGTGIQDPTRFSVFLNCFIPASAGKGTVAGVDR